ncbi:MAG: glycosyltransferase family 2 protein [Ruminiclostridium sp.]|nr:glycosyltransferase family 2 protein [Ruminiclostridium sp.]
MPELTILMPCLNEAKTLASCIAEAKRFIDENGISAEILIADNGSTDGSPRIAEECGARVVTAEEKGYGSALICGINAAEGRYIIMGDCDMSYDFYNIGEFVRLLRMGYPLVMGNRFGGIEKGAMPFLHRYIGIPFLSWAGRMRFDAKVNDFHCGIRGVHRETAMSLGLSCKGMEFATEMIVKFALKGCKIAEIPVVLRKDGRGGKSHIRTFRDGMRHLIFIMTYKK